MYGMMFKRKKFDASRMYHKVVLSDMHAPEYEKLYGVVANKSL